MPPYDEDDMRRAEKIAQKLAQEAEAKRQDEAAREAERKRREG